MNTYNKISIFAEQATESNTQASSSTIGYVYPDSAWQNEAGRLTGAKEGIANSIDYNTALRQSTVIACTLAEALAERNTESMAYPGMNTYGIGTAYDTAQGTLQDHIVNLAKILNKNNFLLQGEVTTSKIADKNVTAGKIADNTITAGQLGNILTTSGNASISATANGMTVGITQTSDKGKLNISLSGDTVTNADNVNITTANTFYIGGVSNTSGYNSICVNSGVKVQGGSIVVSTTNGWIQAPYFTATSDIRRKKDIKKVEDISTIRDIIETTDIITFKYNDSEETNLGVIAQSIDKNIDDFNLVEKDKDGYLMIKESKLVYVLWQYVKELNERIEKLEK